MKLNILKPRKAINKAFLKIKPNRTDIENFKTNLIQLLDRINDTESEEFHKNLVTDFLKKTYYEPNHFINTKGRNDLVIHNGNKAKSTVGVIIEAKKPTNKAEMLKVFVKGDTPEKMLSKINVKAFQELILYYLRERITHKNLEIKYLVATNINEWFIFDSNVFEKQFAQNKGLVKQFNDFENGRLAGKTTDFFYKEIAEPFINDLKEDIEFTFFDIREYENPLRNDNPKDDNKLIALFKLLSPEHLLKLPFTNDSNSLDKRFYGELLHIIGLAETKQGGKKLIERNKKEERNTGSFLENAIIQLDSLDKINRLDHPSHFGTTQEERLFNVGLELSITWINRILFLKLLEAQLKTYHKGDKSYEFLSINKIQNYDDLNSLFFQVLAKQQSERNKDIIGLFSKVPYLNSSLFEPTEIEHGTLFISNLRDDKTIPIYSSTVLKSENGKKLTGNLSAIEYLFEFLDAYDFSSEGSEEIQEDNKTLINASVLGLIFEKINGYKDGSFFTPGFITMYMCRETIRKAIVQKFNDTKDWNCKDMDSIYDKIEDRQEANTIINSLKICDPAVGSGHFLVSALNEIIAIKNDLKILQDRDGKRLKEYVFEVINDELIVTDEDGELFEYNPTNRESQRVQETLFHEKQTLIENCLFGVDINPNSVKICRLRLWIELLKNAYYKNESELETLPNIDINIKCGNSLISRFELDADLKKALKNSKWTIDSYRIAVDTYRNAQNKEQKRAMEKLIEDIKKDFRSEISLNDPKVKKYNKLQGEIFGMTNQTQMFELTKREKAAWNKKLKQLAEDSKKLETIIEEIKNNKIYQDAFEWRFEFPEVLDDNGDFLGFDVVIGNPPYITIGAKESSINDQNEIKFLLNKYISNKYKPNLYAFFYEEAINLLSKNGILSFIVPRTLLDNLYYRDLRTYLNSFKILKILRLDFEVFDDASTGGTNILIVVKEKSNQGSLIESLIIDKAENFDKPIILEKLASKILIGDNKVFSFLDLKKTSIIEKMERCKKVRNYFTVNNGVNTGNCAEILLSKNKESQNHLKILEGKNINKYSIVWKGLWVNYDLNLKKTIDVKQLKTKQKKVDFALRDRRIFDSPKIIIRQTSDRIISSLDINGFITRHSTHCLVNDFDRIDLKLVLAQLNSKLVNFYYNYLIPEKGKVFAEVKGINIKQIPICENPNINQSIIDKVSLILTLKQENPKIDITNIENEIDQLVYQLYDLTEEEIKIIEEANA